MCQRRWCVEERFIHCSPLKCFASVCHTFFFENNARRSKRQISNHPLYLKCISKRGRTLFVAVVVVVLFRSLTICDQSESFIFSSSGSKSTQPTRLVVCVCVFSCCCCNVVFQHTSSPITHCTFIFLCAKNENNF